MIFELPEPCWKPGTKPKLNKEEWELNDIIPTYSSVRSIRLSGVLHALVNPTILPLTYSNLINILPPTYTLLSTHFMQITKYPSQGTRFYHHF